MGLRPRRRVKAGQSAKFVNDRVQFGGAKPGASSPTWMRVCVVLLLISVAGLSTVAKDGQYFPKTNPARFLSMSTKMNLTHAPIVLDGARTQPVVRIAPPLPSVRITRIERSEPVPVQRISVRVSLQHRSPPVSHTQHFCV
jgi:hypothetical protein